MALVLWLLLMVVLIVGITRLFHRDYILGIILVVASLVFLAFVPLPAVFH